MFRLLPALALITLGFAPGVLHADDAADARTEIRLLLERQVADWNSGNLKAFMAGYWNSPDLRFASGGTVTQGWAETLARYERHYDTPEKRGRLEFEVLAIDVLGPQSALAFGRWQLTRAPDAPKPGGLFSLVLRRLPEGWRIVHDHTSSTDP